MGTSASASVVLGVRIQEREISRSVTRYNPKTGEPYQATEEEEVYFLLSTNQEISLPIDEECEEYEELINAYKEGDFGIINADGEYGKGFAVLGLVVARQGGYDDDRFISIGQPTIAQFSLVREKLLGMGIAEEPELLLTLGLS